MFSYNDFIYVLDMQHFVMHTHIDLTIWHTINNIVIRYKRRKDEFCQIQTQFVHFRVIVKNKKKLEECQAAHCYYYAFHTKKIGKAIGPKDNNITLCALYVQGDIDRVEKSRLQQKPTVEFSE